MDNKLQDKFSVVNLANYIQPKVNEYGTGQGRKTPWVEYGIYGVDDFFNIITEKYETSTTNAAIVEATSHLIFGKGLKSKDPNVDNMIYNMLSDNDLNRVIFDLKLYGNAAFQLIYNEDGSKIEEIFHVPVPTLRSGRVNIRGEVECYYYSPDWQAKKVKFEEIPAYTKSQGTPTNEIYYIKPYKPGKFYYGIPDWYAALQYCSVESELSNLHINNILNGFMPLTMINFNNGIPAVEEREQLEMALRQKFVGTNNAGKFLMNFNDGKENATTIDALQVENLHDKYQFISEEATRRIMVAHRVTTPLLFGIREAGAGFSSNAEEMKVGYEIFYTMVVIPFQQMMIDALEDIFYYNDVTEANLYFEPLIPLGFLAEYQEQIGDNAVSVAIEESQTGGAENARQVTGLPDLDPDGDTDSSEPPSYGRVIDGVGSPYERGNKPFAMSAIDKLDYEIFKK